MAWTALYYTVVKLRLTTLIKEHDGDDECHFYHTAAMQARFSYEHPSVCLSVKRVNCDKTNDSSADILIPYERPIHLVFQHEEWLVGGAPPST